MNDGENNKKTENRKGPETGEIHTELLKKREKNYINTILRTMECRKRAIN